MIDIFTNFIVAVAAQVAATYPNLETRHFKNSRKMLSLQQGGYMTLAQFAMTFWHDLAAPILAGIITAAIVGWWRNRK